jgi:hypothetical protein
MRDKNRFLKDVKIVMHNEYNHELAKYYNRKRYMKEDKKFRNKRLRQKHKRFESI